VAYRIQVVDLQDRRELEVIVERLLFGCLQHVLLLVGVSEAFRLVVVHVGQYAAAVRGAPCGVRYWRLRKGQIQLALRHFLSLAAALQQGEQRDQIFPLVLNPLHTGQEAVPVGAQLLSNIGLCFLALVTMMQCLCRVLQAERDQQPDRDGEQVQEELARPVNRVLRCMDIQHRCLSCASLAAGRCCDSLH